MNHQLLSRSVLAAVVALGASAAPALAVPCLQLDIAGGTYYQPSETTISTTDAFTLTALMTLDRGNTLSDFYYVSAAVTPQVAQTTPSPDLGYFTWNGTRYNVTADMVFGTPPLDETLLGAATSDSFDSHDLSEHSIFPTYFTEFRFQFDPDQFTPTAYNTAPDGTDDGNLNQQQFFKTFDVDVSGLKAGYALHFDLYNEALVYETTASGTKQNRVYTTTLSDIDVERFAPYSHDAESCGVEASCEPVSVVPEPATLTLFGTGLFGLAGAVRRRFSQTA